MLCDQRADKVTDVAAELDKQLAGTGERPMSISAIPVLLLALFKPPSTISGGSMHSCALPVLTPPLSMSSMSTQITGGV